MHLIKRLLDGLMWVGLCILLLSGLFLRLRTNSWSAPFHLGYYCPAVSMIAIISGQFDLLTSMYRDEAINIRARALDFIHWLLWIFMYFGSWMVGGVTPLLFVFQLTLLMIIGWQVGVGIRRRWKPTSNETLVGGVTAVLAASLGLIAGYVRTRDPTDRGWGWVLETSTAIGGTALVLWFILEDVKNLRKKAASYPRSLFLKGILCNTLAIWFWIHQIIQGGGFTAEVLTRFAGITFNTVIGNLIYLGYYATFEYYLKKQKQLAPISPSRS